MKKRRKKGGGTVISTALFEFAAPVNPGTWRHVVTWPGRLVRWLIRVDWTFRFYERICYFARARFDFQFNRISASVVCKQMKNDDRLDDAQIHWKKKNLVKSETNLERVARIFEDQKNRVHPNIRLISRSKFINESIRASSFTTTRFSGLIQRYF